MFKRGVLIGNKGGRAYKVRLQLERKLDVFCQNLKTLVGQTHNVAGTQFEADFLDPPDAIQSPRKRGVGNLLVEVLAGCLELEDIGVGSEILISPIGRF